MFSIKTLFYLCILRDKITKHHMFIFTGRIYSSALGLSGGSRRHDEPAAKERRRLQRQGQERTRAHPPLLSRRQSQCCRCQLSSLIFTSLLYKVHILLQTSTELSFLLVFLVHNSLRVFIKLLLDFVIFKCNSRGRYKLIRL